METPHLTTNIVVLLNEEPISGFLFEIRCILEYWDGITVSLNTKKLTKTERLVFRKNFFYLIFKCEIDITDEDNKMTKETMFKNLINKNKSLCAGF